MPKQTQTKHTIALTLLPWHAQAGRKHLPWQQSPTPYTVWLSEIMLQQTQVNTVIPYFQTFLKKFPTLKKLAQAPLDQVLHLWAGLGYYSRARNLHKTAQHILKHHEGEFPTTLEALITLPGIGRSTAGAILSLGLNQQATILDGNVKRVLCRYYGIDTWAGETNTQKKLWDLAEKNTPHAKKCAVYNQAMMDLGALICTRTKPQCTVCPLKKTCLAHTEKRTHQLPIPKPKKTKPTRKIWMLVLKQNEKIWLTQRPASGIWGGLWSLPESKDADEFKALRQTFSKKKPVALPNVRHEFTHFRLMIEPYLLTINARPTIKTGVWYDLKNPAELGLPAPIQRLLKDLNKTSISSGKGLNQS